MSVGESARSAAPVKTKLNLGCGDDIRAGYVNVDIAARPGVDAVFSLAAFPWPLPDNHFTEVRCIDILEHLPDTIRTVEELWRVCADGAVVEIRVPYWNSRWAWGDPQHVRTFTQDTFGFFDPDNAYCQRRSYYSQARFRVAHIVYEGCFFRMKWGFRWKVPAGERRRLIHLLTKLSDMVHFLQFRLVAIKEGGGKS